MKKIILVLFFGMVHISYSQWQECNKGLYGEAILSTAISGNNIFVVTDRVIYLSTDNGDSWTEKNTGLTKKEIRSIAISDNNIFVGTYFGGVFLSTDNGNSWTNTGLTDKFVSSIAISSNNIFVGTWISGIFLSTDSGNSWTEKNTGLTNKNVYSKVVRKPYP